MNDEKTTNPAAIARFVVHAEDAGKRLDVLLAEQVPELSRRRARVLISAGSVFVDAHRVLVHSRRIGAGREIVCHHGVFVTERPDALHPDRVLHEDDALIAIDKPAGVPSHPTMARRQGTALQLVEEMLRRRAGQKVPLWPIHRLDAGTSGVLLFAKSREAARSISQSLARRRVRKVYVALVARAPEPAEGEIRLPLAEGTLRTVASTEGKEALTRYRVIERFPRSALLEIEPETGRMHQIRVHLAAIGHPVLGDTKYGAGEAPRLYLHASRIELRHPAGGRPFVVESPVPLDWLELAPTAGER